MLAILVSRVRSAAVILAATCSLACLTAEKRELDIMLAPAESLGAGQAIVLTEVKDSRLFVASERTGKDASPHQLATGGAEDPAVTARTFGQMRSAGAEPIFDFLLPEGRSVAGLARQAIENGFRRAGYRVIPPGEPAAAEAIGIFADVLRFWSWNSGSWTFTFTFETDIALRGALPSLGEQRNVTGTVSLHSAVAARPGSFVNTTTKGLESFIANLDAALREER